MSAKLIKNSFLIEGGDEQFIEGEVWVPNRWLLFR